MDWISTAFDAILHLDTHLEYVVQSCGPWIYAVLFLVVFAETGLVVTPFLPGDSLLFALGAVAALPGSDLSVTLLLVLLMAAAVIGDAVNYAIGLRLGPAVFRSESSRLLNRKHLQRAQEFYEKYGSKTIILARFVPIVRTFAPFVAGIGKMSYPRFFLYNVVGAVAWVAICLFAGVFFGGLEVVKKNFALVVLGIVFVSVLPMAVELFLAWRRKPAASPPTEAPAAGPAPERETSAA